MNHKIVSFPSPQPQFENNDILVCTPYLNY